MKLIRIYFIIGVSLALLVTAFPLLIASSASSSSATLGYVSYQVTLNRQGSSVPNTFVVNESSVPTNQKDLDTITVGLVSSLQNITYSKVVNTSSIPEVFPFIPGITNQTFSYATHGLSIGAQITNVGTTTFTFNGTSYSAQRYSLSLSVKNSSSSKTMLGNGTLLAFPSGLLYSVQIQNSNATYSASVQLLATNLPLKEPSNSMSTTEGIAMIGAGILGAVAIAVPWKFRRKKSSTKSSSSVEKKPSYWVD